MIFLAGAVFGGTCVCLAWLGAQMWRIVQDYRRRSRLRAFELPEHTTLLDVIFREVHVFREKRALKRHPGRPEEGL